MDVFALDVETTISNTGDPFDETNFLVLGAYGDSTNYYRFLSRDVQRVQEVLDSAKLVVLFNAKFDLHWLRRIGCTINPRLAIWDVQLAEFILSNQKWKYPSLDKTCDKYGIGHKLDVVKLEYWEKGIDTDKIPFEILDEYLQQDISLTYQAYLRQVEEFKKPEHQSKLKIFRLQCYDLLVLEEMEYNGFLFDVENATKKAKEIDIRREEIEHGILSRYPDIPINLGSGDHVSCILYGGIITHEYRIPIGVYKSGAKVGQTRYKVATQEFKLPRLIEPSKGSELAKEGYFATDESTLKNLKPSKEVKQIIDLLLERRGLEKLRGTYYQGIPDKISEHNWKDNLVHGSLNQCVTGTSRLSATKPNSQNMPPDCKRLCISRYE